MMIISTPVALTANVLRLGEGCLTDAQFSYGISTAAFAKPLLCAGRFISTKFNLKTKWKH